MTQLRQQASTRERTDIAHWDDGTGVIVTFNTVKHQLWREWEKQCVKRERRAESLTEDELRRSDGHIANHSEFQAANIVEPGIHDDYFDTQRTEFLVVVPRDALTQRASEFWVRKLNAKYRKDYNLNWKDTVGW
jgi:hypothetical protein